MGERGKGSLRVLETGFILPSFYWYLHLHVVGGTYVNIDLLVLQVLMARITRN